MKVSKFREVAFINHNAVDEFIDSLYYKLKAISPDLDFNVIHGDIITTIIFSGNNLEDYYFHQISEASKESNLTPHNFSIARRGTSYVIKIKH